MSKSLKVITTKEVLTNKRLNIYGSVEEPLFLARDIAEMIEHSDLSRMVNLVDEDEKLKRTLYVSGQNRKMWFLTEEGVYEVLFESRKPIAKTFKKQVKSILKELRLSGVVIMNNAKEETIDFKKKYGVYRIRKTFNKSENLKADYAEYKELAAKEQKLKHITAKDRIKLNNIIFNTVSEKLSTEMGKLKGSEMLCMQELLTDIKSDTLKLSNRKNGQIKSKIKKEYDKYLDQMQEEYKDFYDPALESMYCINYSGFSINCKDDYKSAYDTWCNNFPKNSIHIDPTLDFNKPIFICLKFVHPIKVDVQNLSKTFIDMLCKVYSQKTGKVCDDRFFQISQCVTAGYCDSFDQGKIYYKLKQGFWE